MLSACCASTAVSSRTGVTYCPWTGYIHDLSQPKQVVERVSYYHLASAVVEVVLLLQSQEEAVEAAAVVRSCW